MFLPTHSITAQEVTGQSSEGFIPPSPQSWWIAGPDSHVSLEVIVGKELMLSGDGGGVG